MMTNIIVALVVVLILGAAIGYIVKEKKKGTVCIGCPAAGTCSRNKTAEGGCACSCGCGNDMN